MNDQSNSGEVPSLGRVPVTLVTSFLGVGKTTLVNHLLCERGGRRVVVIENEFGSLGIDSECVGSDAEVVMALNEGCLCCSLQDDLFKMFEELAGQIHRFDQVVIEASGLANPATVMRAFERPEIRSGFRHDVSYSMGSGTLLT
ncbi:MAG: GTP-binding protein [Myxococcota bacterium]|nr:GTP-binding protein [Myxococcota bacterium]